eukprot:3516532-Pleurochrysis_carterae.AAC.1
MRTAEQCSSAHNLKLLSMAALVSLSYSVSRKSYCCVPSTVAECACMYEVSTVACTCNSPGWFADRSALQH